MAFLLDYNILFINVQIVEALGTSGKRTKLVTVSEQMILSIQASQYKFN